MKYDVYGIGNPLLDINADVDDKDIAALGLDKGIMHLIDLEKRNKLSKFLKNRKIERYVAGSCPNTMRAVARLGGKSVISGKVGDDPEGRFFIESIQKLGVVSDVKSEPGITGTSTILVTPDSERTMNTFLGNCRKYSKKDVDAEKLKNSKLFYTTGYMWDTESQKEAVLYAMDIAKNNNVKVVFSLADPFLVKRNREDFVGIIKKYVDLVISNEEEARNMTGKDTAEGIKRLNELSESVIITLGRKGSIVADSGKICELKAFPVEPVDTTGAGDIYAAGVLYGLSKGMSLKDSAQLGGLYASWIVTQKGVRL
ncbi:adenosine kinase [Candidatus Woesearchaeota archaeon]|nr:adenosine kinase [Candidatus Woesearchaeota archaeon]